MANSLSSFVDIMLAKGLMATRKLDMIPLMFNGDYSPESAKRGDTIEVPLPGVVSVNDVAPGNTPPTTGDVSTTHKQIQLDRWKEAAFVVADDEFFRVSEDFIPVQATEAVKALVEEINGHVVDQLILTSATLRGTPGTSLFATAGDVSDATNAMIQLTQNEVPEMDRTFLLSLPQYGRALNQRAFQDAAWSASAEVIRNGKMMHTLGFNWAKSQHMPMQTPPGAVTVNDATGRNRAAGVTQLTVDGAGAASTKVGQYFYTASKNQMYRITGRGNTRVTFTPGLKSAVADDEVLMFPNTINAAFHKDALAFAMRTMVTVPAPGSEIRAAQDPASGLTLRFELHREHRRNRSAYDLLYGCDQLRENFSVLYVT